MSTPSEFELDPFNNLVAEAAPQVGLSTRLDLIPDISLSQDEAVLCAGLTASLLVAYAIARLLR